ncbi:hypothetical protein B0F90DRAFT_1171661 [Multifurca ochricompacta]|uniref:Uncharacterized protein n=1 Tax=Multifurca ochricompacta TaxID=376703 RepID=A0AAD4QQH0_9AGAM|nr:hypothetical protein B0F90DRAFT_1171661 [Multifurca ochricompacta]
MSMSSRSSRPSGSCRASSVTLLSKLIAWSRVSPEPLGFPFSGSVWSDLEWDSRLESLPWKIWARNAAERRKEGMYVLKRQESTRVYANDYGTFSVLRRRVCGEVNKGYYESNCVCVVCGTYITHAMTSHAMPCHPLLTSSPPLRLDPDMGWWWWCDDGGGAKDKISLL